MADICLIIIMIPEYKIEYNIWNCLDHKYVFIYLLFSN